MSETLEHAMRELKLGGFIGGRPKKGDSIDQHHRACGKAALQLIQLFRKQGHSGDSAVKTTQIFTLLVEHRPLSANDHSVHQDVGVEADGPKGTILQDLRDFSFFSIDGGKTWFDVTRPLASKRAWNTVAGRRIRRHQKQFWAKHGPTVPPLPAAPKKGRR